MKIFPYSILSVLALTTATLSAANAQEDVTELDEVVVTATRTPLEIDKLPAIAIVIDRATIERAVGADLGGLLRQHAGLDVATSGGPGQNISLFMRGSESNHVLVLVDGVEMNPGSIGGAAFQHIPLENIERIEIIKGPRSALYGSEAIGGVINIITRRSDDTRVHAAATFGSFNTRQLDLGLLGAHKAWQYGIEIGTQDTDGFPTHVASTEDRGYERRRGSAYLKWQGDFNSVELRHWQAEGTNEYSGFSLEPLSQDFRNRVSSLDIRTRFTETWNSTVLISEALDDVDQNDANFLGERDFTTTERQTIDWQNDFSIGEHHLLTAGFYREDSEITALSFGGSIHSDETIDALYLQNVATFDNDTLVTAIRRSNYDAFDDNTTWNAGWTHPFAESHQLVVAAGSGYRAPDATDRFGYGGNPDLEPEISRNLELGWQWDATANQQLGINLFRNDIEQLIAFVDPDGFAGPDPGSNINIDEARIDGVEVSYRLYGNNWSIQSEAVVQSPVDLATDTELARRSRRSLTIRYLQQLGDWEIGVGGLARSESLDSPFNDIVLPGYGLVELTAAWTLSPQWKLLARVENALDKEYATAAGYRTAERSFYLSIRYQ